MKDPQVQLGSIEGNDREMENQDNGDVSSVQLLLQIKNAPTSYANMVFVEVGPYDLKLSFGLRIGNLEPDILHTVIMSPEHAASLSQLLSNATVDFEDTYGKIPHATEPKKVMGR